MDINGVWVMRQRTQLGGALVAKRQELEGSGPVLAGYCFPRWALARFGASWENC